MKRVHQILIGVPVVAGLAVWLISAGCEGTGQTGGGPSLFSPANQGERWTICCRRLSAPGHAQAAEMLGTMLRQVKQLNPQAVRVVTGPIESAVYYGEYRRVPARPGSDDLAFPPEYQRDIALIRSLTDGVSTPFLAAQPELIESPGARSEHPEWEATNAKGTHSLLIAVFYNTENFQQRKEVAEQYVSMLREEGFPAYYYHEPVKSFVFVGDFTEQDVIITPEGRKPGPRVEQLIARREEEFRYFTQNGHIIKYIEGPGREISPPSQIVPLPTK